jgi:hypothetical protein
MRATKVFSFVAVAAIMSACIGVTSAMATELENVVLCKNRVEDPCSNAFPSGTVLHAELASGTKSVFLTNLGNVECASSTLLATTISPLAHGEVTALAFGGCELGKNACTVTATNTHLNYLLKGELNTAHTSYEFLVTEKANGKPQILTQCGILIKCNFASSSILDEALGEVNDTVLDVLQTLDRERDGTGSLCPSTVVWHAKYLLRCLTGESLVACWPKMELF